MSTNLLDFISESKNQFFTVANSEKILIENGYKRLFEEEDYKIENGGKYYVIRNGSSLIAFEIPKCQPVGFMIGASHTDSPTFRVKDNPTTYSNGYVKINLEKYGGMICSTWMDRPLSIAGRVIFSEGGKVKPVLFDFGKPVCIIPSVAIHMNRNCNENASFNAATDMQAFYSLDKDTDFISDVASVIGKSKDDILSTDLYLYSSDGKLWGMNNEFITSPRIDDLQCLYSLLCGFVSSNTSKAIKVLYLADNEEVGSSTRQGAASMFLSDTLKRAVYALNGNEADYCKLVSNSFMVSADNGHAIHPNHPEYSDKDNHPEINKGIVIKFNANQKYCTDGISAGIFKEVCKYANVPTQVFANRSDMAGGSTLGNIAAEKVCVMAVDIGLPQLAMHSAYETAGVYDSEYLTKAMECFFSSNLKNDEGSYIIER